MKLLIGLASVSLLTLVGCTPTEDTATDTPEEAAISAVDDAAATVDAAITTDAEAECEGANCDTGGNGRPVEAVDPSL